MSEFEGINAGDGEKQNYWQFLSEKTQQNHKNYHKISHH